MNKLIIYAIFLLGTFGTTFVASKFELRKQRNRFEKQIKVFKADSTLKSQKIKILAESLTLKSNSDSLKSEFISQMQSTLQVLKKENTAQKSHIQALEAWKLDAQDGVITDTVRVGLFGKIKKKK